MADLGEILTQNVQPLQPPQGAPNFLDLSPTARTALLSFGLQAMQPVGVGQSQMGHLAQAIGAAGEAVTRQELMDQKDQLAQSKLTEANQYLDIARQQQATRELDSERRHTRGMARAANTGRGLTDAFRARSEERQTRDYNTQIEKRAKELDTKVNDPIMGRLIKNTDPDYKFQGMSRDQIREMLKQTTPLQLKTYGGAPAAAASGVADDDEDEAADADTMVRPSEVVTSPMGRITGAQPAIQDAAPTGMAVPQSRGRAQSIPPAAAEHLRKNPGLAPQFDEWYGPGASRAVLGR